MDGQIPGVDTGVRQPGALAAEITDFQPDWLNALVVQRYAEQPFGFHLARRGGTDPVGARIPFHGAFGDADVFNRFMAVRRDRTGRKPRSRQRQCENTQYGSVVRLSHQETPVMTDTDDCSAGRPENPLIRAFSDLI